MAVTLSAVGTADQTPAPWLDPARYWGSLATATEGLESPLGVLELGALRFNTHDLVRRAAGKPIRVASKSIRIRGLTESLLATEGYAGVLAFTLPEALWLAETVDDVVVGYPTADAAALRRLASDPVAAARVTLMVDSLEHLDFIDACIAPQQREVLRPCLELDVSWSSRVPVGHVGVWRSPLRTPEDAAAFARTIERRPGFRLVGMMAYEAQIAGLGDRDSPTGTWSKSKSWIKRRSVPELTERRGLAVASVRNVAELEFVNGGGTGSLETTSQDDSITEVAAGSGILGGHLFDLYRSFHPAPAASFALSVVRKPTPTMAVILGGGWVASGPPGDDRMPQLAWPANLHFVRREMAGEVQTPVHGSGAETLRPGDRVWLRHAKSGELSERINEFVVVDGDRVVDRLTTYRGEGKAFL
ncbi:amino acid deaminase/aldolase [Mycetocola manganoxydans]|uniref:Amino acid deaminase/aldolase n=1 Tax=Mycetocola manganoxydans TaxID=699879 RepID=A0A3L6ZNA7_9MICO|nr:alanine racemase [Mycetocola manganoxydans]RLP69387.1 amino acid deaminase/aldolase [Mycetocola manganoxydans]GHD50749.1 alanine racemase [Mycetocola manganoxydans]